MKGCTGQKSRKIYHRRISREDLRSESKRGGGKGGRKDSNSLKEVGSSFTKWLVGLYAKY